MATETSSTSDCPQVLDGDLGADAGAEKRGHPSCFKHLVNYQRESGFNAVNVLQGYPPVRMLSPLELIDDDDETS